MHEQQVGQAIDVAERAPDRPAARARPCGVRRGGRPCARRAARRRPGVPPARMKRRSGGSSASSRSISCSSRATSSSPIDGLGDARRRACRPGSASCAPSANRSRWMCDELGVEVGVERRRADEAEPGVQLVDLAVRVDARVGLADARAVEERRLAGVAGARVDFHVGRELYEMAVKNQTHDARRSPMPRAARSPALPAAAADLVPPPRPRPAVAQDRRPVPHPRLRDHAAADAGRSRAAEVRRVARQVSVAATRWPTRPSSEVTETWYPLGYNIRPKRLQSHRARSRSRATAASCRPTRRRCCRSRASAPTPPARSAASRSASAPPSSTPTSRACCSACSSATAIRRATR